MEKKWRRIGKGETIPTSSIIRPIDGGLPNITGSCVMMGQDCYYISVDDVYELLKDLPLETEAEAKERNEATIIKKLIGLVKETEFLSEENRTSLLGWLEKQGEQKQELLTKEKALKNSPFVEKEPVDLVAILKDYFAHTPKEQQNKDWEELKHLNNFGWELVEQKPTWSEEDDFMYNKIKNLLTDISLAPESRNSLFDWLKDLKNRVQPQPRQEWNEEDERLFQIVIDILDRQNHLGNISHTDLIACVRKLKSLRPQSTWKPSKEQMKAIEFMVRSFGESGTLSPYGETMAYATSLLNDLKKL